MGEPSHANPDDNGFCGNHEYCFAEVGKPSWTTLPCPADCDDAIALDEPDCDRCGDEAVPADHMAGRWCAACLREREGELEAAERAVLDAAAAWHSAKAVVRADGSRTGALLVAALEADDVLWAAVAAWKAITGEVTDAR